MSVNAREQWELEFVDGLVGAGNENMKLTGGDDDRRQAMWNIANPIIKAIKRGVATIHFVGSFSVTQLNALQSKEQNGIYGVTDDGLLTNPDGTTLQVTAGSSVMWDGSWREFLDIDLSGYYTKEQVDSLIATAVAEFTAAVANESSLRESADATLQGNIDAEASERSSADNALDERVAYLEEATSSYEVNSNKVNAIDDSTTHYPTTHAVTAAIGAEATARESADSALNARIDGEETAREQADSELQAQIDAISSKSDVVDVVASYVELIAYDTSALGDNDVIKVLEDETQDDAESYYRWNLTTQTWGYIGSQGPFVTPAEMQTALNGKVDKVTGKGLSTNDYTTTEKNKLAGIETGANKTVVDSALSSSSSNPVQNKAVKSAVDRLQSALDNCVKPCAVISDSGGDYTVWVIKTKVLFLADANVSTPLFIRLVGASYDSKNIDIQISSYRSPYNSTSGNFLGFTNLSGSFVPQIYEDYYTGDDGKLYKRFYIVSSKHSYMVYVYAWFQSSRHIGSSSLDGWTVEYSNTAPVVGENFCVRVTEYSSISALQLLNSRNLKVNLASTSAQSFNGSANAENIGVTGTLPIANGGTGATTAAAARTNLGLGNVENESVSDGTPDFTEATTRANIASGEKMSVLFGKIKKWFADLKALAFKDNVSDGDINGTISDSHIASASTWNGKYTKPSGGIPKSDLASAVQTSLGLADSAVQDSNYVHTDNNYTDGDAEKLAGIEAGADKSHVKFFLYNADYANIAAAMPYASSIYNVFLVGKEDGTYPRSYALVKFDRTNEEMVFVAMRNDSTLCTITKKRSLGTGWTYRDYPLAPQSHASSDTTYGTGDATHYGHVKVDSSLSDTSTNPVQNKIVTAAINTSAPYIINADSATTAIFDEAVSRYNSGKLVFIRKGVYILQCVGATSAQMLFESVAGGTAGISKGVIDWRRGGSVPSITWLNAAARDGSNATGTWGINISGNAASATKLSSARNLKVSLNSTSSQSFDGSANAESIGVDGTLHTTHGGTGATTPAGARANLGLGNFSPGAKTGLYGLELLTTEVVDIALSDSVYDTTLFVEYCRSSSDADGHHPELLAISFRYDTSEASKWVSTPRMAVLYSFNASSNYFKPELKYTADGHILLNLSASRRHAGQVTIIASSANCSFITVSKLAMSSSVWTGATAVTDVRVNAIDDTVVHKAGDETITGAKTVSTSGKVGFILEDDTDARLRARQTGSTTRYIQFDVESGTAGSNVAVYARNGNTNGSYLVSIDSSTVNPGGRGVSGLGHSTDTVVRLGSKKLDFSGTMGSSADTVYFV